MQNYYPFMRTSRIALHSAELRKMYLTLCLCISLSVHIKLSVSWQMSKKRELMAFTFPFILFALLNVIEHKKQTVSCVISSLPVSTYSQESLSLNIPKINHTIL
jgi:hypothetical protein